MPEIQPFTFPDTGEPVRGLLANKTPWFVGRDAAVILGHANPARAVRDHVPAAHRGVTESVTPDDLHGLDPQTVLISEAGLYRLIMRSNTADAERFQEWVTAEVLPAIRRTGSYVAPTELGDPLAELERQTHLTSQAIDFAKRERADREAAQQRAAELEPAAHAWDTLADAEGDYSLREAAQVLDRDPAISTGQNRLARSLREFGWTASDGQPYQRHVDTGRLVRRTVTYPHPRTGVDQTTTQPRITAKGLQELHELLRGGGQLRLIDGGAA